MADESTKPEATVENTTQQTENKSQKNDSNDASTKPAGDGNQKTSSAGGRSGYQGQRSGGGGQRGGGRYRQQGRQQQRRSGGYNRRGRYSRRKVCMFCANKDATINWKKVDTFRRFVADSGAIHPRRKSGLCARHQRRVAIAVKRARHIALLPFTTEHVRIMGKN